jgi:hypothetical protein
MEEKEAMLVDVSTEREEIAYSGASRHPIPIQVATQFRLIPPWESDPFRHPLGEGVDDAG